MTQAKLKTWLGYWKAAKMVAVDEIRSVEDAADAIKYCKCLRSGIAWDLTPAQLFKAVESLRT